MSAQTHRSDPHILNRRACWRSTIITPITAGLPGRPPHSSVSSTPFSNGAPPAAGTTGLRTFYAVYEENEITEPGDLEGSRMWMRVAETLGGQMGTGLEAGYGDWVRTQLQRQSLELRAVIGKRPD